MSEVFVVGKLYEAAENGYDPIIILKRTDKTCWVQNYPDGSKWRMRIKHDADGNEILVDSSVPLKWRDSFTYSAKWLTTWE